MFFFLTKDQLRPTLSTQNLASDWRLAYCAISCTRSPLTTALMRSSLSHGCRIHFDYDDFSRQAFINSKCTQHENGI
uniref:Uncharacterized protein n=1 Tax=Arundo donax TaxID=35708 RepID=A0A0A9GUH7_ARUDO